MKMMSEPAHAALMDKTYVYQRLIYDITRRYYLLGRDHLIANLQPPANGFVLEVACGTGRNLVKIAKSYPTCKLFGLDISKQMLRTAASKLGGRARLGVADACDFDADYVFAEPSNETERLRAGSSLAAGSVTSGFDRIVLSYSLSMIPDWKAALLTTARQLRPSGELHIVDFGHQKRLPNWFANMLSNWLAHFHVTPRADLKEQMQIVANDLGYDFKFEALYRDYAQYGVLTRPVV